MLMFEQHPGFRRFVSFVVLMSFGPVSVDYWNFLPQVVLSRAEAETAHVETSPAPALATEALPQAPATRVALSETPPQANPAPVAAEAAVTPAEAQPAPAPIQVAQVEAELAQVAASVPERAAVDWAAAEGAFQAGDRASAFREYVLFVDHYKYNGVPEAQAALGRMKACIDTATPAQLAAMEAALPTFNEVTTAAGAYILPQFYCRRAEALKAKDEAAWRRDMKTAQAVAWDVVSKYPESGESLRLISDILNWGAWLGSEDEAGTAQQVREYILKSGDATGAWWGRLALGCWAYDRNSVDESRRVFTDVYEGWKAGAFARFTETRDLPVEYRILVEYGLVGAAYMAGHLEEALALSEQLQTRYDAVVQAGLPGTEWVLEAGLMKARATAELNPGDPYQGIVAFSDFVKRYPKNGCTARAQLQIGGLYMLGGDYQQAADYFRQIVQDAPDSPLAQVARQELAFIMENLYDSVEVASGQPVVAPANVQVAQNCGPLALRKLLALNGVTADEAELERLAGMDPAGTTMKGLIEAAKAKGLELAGVQADEVEQLATPFIAYLNRDHFLVVTQVREDGIVVSDRGEADTILSRAEFARMWDGQALVRATIAASLLRPLDPGQLRGAKGGSPDLHGSPSTPPPCDPPGGGGGGSSVGGGGDPCDSSDSHSPGVLPGEPGSPTARTGVSAPGVHPVIDTLQTAINLSETDVVAGIRGPMTLSFDRTFMNEKGIPRAEFTDVTKTWSNNIGKGWTHSLNMHLKTASGTTPYNVTFYDETGTARDYYYASTSGGYNWYYRTSYGSTGEKANVLKRNTTTKRYTLELISGLTYEFSAATTDTNRYARLETIKDLSGGQMTLEYNGAVGTGRLTKVSPPSGDTRYLQLSYAGNLITKVDLRTSSQVLNTSSFAYSNNELTKVTDAASQTVQYAYGTNANRSDSRYITSITDKKGFVTSFDWSFALNGGGIYEAYKIDLTNAGGLKTTYERSISSNVCVTTNWDGTTNLSKVVNTPLTGDPSRTSTLDYYTGPTTYERWTYEYDANKNMTRVLRPGGVVHRQYTYTSQGRFSTYRIGASGPVTTCEYAAGNSYATKITDGTGLATYYDYDANKRITKVRPPHVASAGFTYAYDAYGQVTATTNPLNQTTAYAFDAAGNNTSVTDAANATQTMAYDALGNVTQVTDFRNKVWRYDYAYGGCGGCGNSGGGLVTKMRDPLNQETSLAYDNNGMLTLTTDALGHSTAYFYDAMNRRTKVESPASSGTQATMAYDKLGRITSETDFDGESVSFGYDHRGRETSSTDAVGTEFSYYDSSGNLSTVTDSLSHTTDYDYTADDLLTKTTYANAKVEVNAYDAAYRMTKTGAGSAGSIDPTEYSFSSTTGLATKVRYTSGSTNHDAYYHYDGMGRLTRLTDWLDGTNGIRYSYDAVGRLTTLTDYDNATLTYAYDAGGNVTSMTDYHGNTTTYTYTDRGQLSTLTAPGGRTWDYDYNAIGQPTQVLLANGITTVYGYDTRNRMTKIEHKDGSTVVAGWTYSLTAEGDITRATNQDNSYWDYRYDGRNRLTKAERKDSGATLLKRWTYSYSSADNITTKEVFTPPNTTETTAFAYNAGNELTSQTVGGVTTNFGYDAWGRMTGKTQGTYSATYAYGQGDKLTGVTSTFPGEGNVTYAYGGDDNRRERNDGTITKYRWDADWSVINEEDSSGTLVQTRIENLAEIPGANPSTGSYRYYLLDRLGSTRQLCDQSKVTLGQYEYDPYGSDYVVSGVAASQGFAGYAWDATLKAYGTPFRFYSPQMLRWQTRDPLGFVDGPNVYGYVGGNPIMFSDPLGLLIAPLPSNIPSDCLWLALGGLLVLGGIVLVATTAPGLLVAAGVAAALVLVAPGASAAGKGPESPQDEMTGKSDDEIRKGARDNSDKRQKKKFVRAEKDKKKRNKNKERKKGKYNKGGGGGRGCH